MVKKKRKKRSNPDPVTYQLYSSFSNKEEFPIGTVIIILIIIIVFSAVFFGDGAVNECAKGFSGLIPCHCYTENLPARCI